MIEKARLDTSVPMSIFTSSKSKRVDPEIDSSYSFAFLDQSETKVVDYQSDLYNLTNCIHQLLYFDNLSTVLTDGMHMPRSKLKRYWNQELWTDVFTVLLNDNCSNSPSKVRCEEIERLICRMQQELTTQLDSRKFNVSLFIYFEH